MIHPQPRSNEPITETQSGPGPSGPGPSGALTGRPHNEAHRPGYLHHNPADRGAASGDVEVHSRVGHLQQRGGLNGSGEDAGGHKDPKKMAACRPPLYSTRGAAANHNQPVGNAGVFDWQLCCPISSQTRSLHGQTDVTVPQSGPSHGASRPAPPRSGVPGG